MTATAGACDCHMHVYDARYAADRIASQGSGFLKKLNLGCGDKILPGYVNVDVAASRRGLKPDVLCDLHRLTPFENNR